MHNLIAAGFLLVLVSMAFSMTVVGLLIVEEWKQRRGQ